LAPEQGEANKSRDNRGGKAMSQEATGARGSAKVLFPYQKEFIDKVMGKGFGRIVALRAEVGLGKTTAIAGLIGRMLEAMPNGRVIVLCPSALQSEWKSIIENSEVECDIVDRYRLRKLMDEYPGNAFVGSGAVSILSDDFAKRPDVLGMLVKAHWDLVVADEAHRFLGQRAALLRSLEGTAKRLVLCSSISFSMPPGVLSSDPVLLEWKREDLMSLDGSPLGVHPRPSRHDVIFLNSEEERELEDVVHVFANELRRGAKQQQIASVALIRSYLSSPAALESALRGLLSKNQLAEADESYAELDDDAVSQSKEEVSSSESQARVEQRALRALEMLDSLSSDSKLISFTELVTKLSSDTANARRVCVLVDYISTLHYVSTELESKGWNCVRLWGGMSIEERYRASEEFISGQRILVASTASIAYSSNLNRSSDLVLYDSLMTSLKLAAIEKFDTMVRKDPLTIHVLRKKGSERVRLPWEQASQ
jgi:SNF2 family DNA or RNA helicase